MSRTPHSRRRVSAWRLPLSLAVAGALAVAVAPVALAAPVVPDAGHAGLYGSASATYDGVFRQSLAILGLHAAGEGPDSAAITWLENQQCADGGFPSFNPDPSPTCPAFDSGSFAGGESVDATAVAAQALRSEGDTTPATAAEAWLAANQDSNGGWDSTIGDGSGSNPDSTGLAEMALSYAGVTPTYDATAYMAGQQIGRTTPASAPGDAGGIAYGDATAPDVYSTMQAIPGIVGANLADVSAPPVSVWPAGTTAYATEPPSDAADVADWATTWLATRTSDPYYTSNLAWVILSYAADSAAHTSAETAYDTLRTSVSPTDPGALGLAALAATAMRETTDAQRFATLIQATLTPDTGLDAGAPSTFTESATTAWTGQDITIGNPYAGTTLPLTQQIAWGDGSTSNLAALTATHHYANAGTYRPTVTLTYTGDARPATVTLAAIAVAKDATAPTVTLTTPSSPTHVASWATLRGTAHDSGRGVATVTLHLAEKRSGHWYSYSGTTWTKRSSYTAAMTVAKRIAVTPSGTGTTVTWSLKLAKLTTGELKIAYSAKDKAGNASATKATTATLTK